MDERGRDKMQCTLFHTHRHLVLKRSRERWFGRKENRIVDAIFPSLPWKCVLWRRGSVSHFTSSSSCCVKMTPQRLLILALLPLLALSQSMWDSAMWTWVSGNSTANDVGIYGTKGVPSFNNYPGSRSDNSMVFHPSMYCLFVFGGYGTTGMFPVISHGWLIIQIYQRILERSLDV